MKLHYTLLIFAVFVFGLISCKKGSNSDPIIGKWQETRLRYYEINANKLVRDTTYLSPFTDLDYVQFNSNSTCTFSSDHYYYPNELNYPTTPQAIPQFIDTLTFNSFGGGKYVISNTNQGVNFSGFILTDTAFVTGNTLRLQVINYGISRTDGFQDVSDSYFTKVSNR